MPLSHLPLRQIAAEHPQAAELFARFEIDLEALGDKPLAEVCACLSLCAEQVEQKLAAMVAPAGCTCDPATQPLTQLIQHIVRVHHRRVRQDLAVLAQSAVTLSRQSRPLEFGPLAQQVGKLHADLLTHINREEQVLFPFIARMEEERRVEYPAGNACFSSLETPLTRMQQSHDAAGQAMHELRGLTNDFEPGSRAGAQQRALFSGLRSFDDDLRRHIDLEDNFLFPRALSLEAELTHRRPL